MANTKRKTKDQKFIELAKAVSNKSTCFRAHHGAVIVKGDEVISKGFNNAPEGAKNCKEFGNCLRVKLKIPRG